MTAYALVSCDVPDGRHGCPNRVEVTTTPDRQVAFLRDLRRAGWTRTRKAGDVCPAHGATQRTERTGPA